MLGNRTWDNLNLCSQVIQDGSRINYVLLPLTREVWFFASINTPHTLSIWTTFLTMPLSHHSFCISILLITISPGEEKNNLPETPPKSWALSGLAEATVSRAVLHVKNEHKLNWTFKKTRETINSKTMV